MLAELFAPGKCYRTMAAFKEPCHLFGDVLRRPLRKSLQKEPKTEESSQKLVLVLKSSGHVEPSEKRDGYYKAGKAVCLQLNSKQPNNNKENNLSEEHSHGRPIGIMA